MVGLFLNRAGSARQSESQIRNRPDRCIAEGEISFPNYNGLFLVIQRSVSGLPGDKPPKAMIKSPILGNTSPSGPP